MNPARKKVRVAIIGVGNCASSLVQGVAFYKSAPDDEFVPGLMHVRLGDYHVPEAGKRDHRDDVPVGERA